MKVIDSEIQDPSKSASFQTRLVLYGMLGLLLILCLRQAAQVYRDFSFPGELTYPNSEIVYKAREYRDGRPIYVDWRKEPHAFAIYGPLVYVIPGLIGRYWFVDEVGLFKIGRAVSLFCFCGLGIILYSLLAFREKVRFKVALVMALLFMTGKVCWPVVACCRPDAPAVFFSLMGLMFFLRWEHSFLHLASIAPFLVAFLFKQSAIAAPISIAIYLVLKRRTMDSASFVLLAGLLFGGIFLSINFLTGGMFYFNTVEALNFPTTWSNVWTVGVKSAIFPCLVSFLLGFLGLLYRLYSKDIDIYCVYLPISFGLAMAATIRNGSAENYFLEPLAVSCILGGRVLERVIRLTMLGNKEGTAKIKTIALWKRSFSVGVLLISLLFTTYQTVNGLSDLSDFMISLQQTDERDSSQLQFLRGAAAELDALNGPILCQYDPINLFCKNSKMFDSFFCSGLADIGLFDDKNILSRIRKGQYAAIVLHGPLSPQSPLSYQSTPFFRKEWQQAMQEAGYYCAKRWGNLFVYRPR